MSAEHADMDRGALFSPDEAYRWALWRTWEMGARRFVVIGLNPSTADATKDDPTIRRCIGFAKREGCGSLVMLNLFAVRATDPKVMLAHLEPVGDENDAYISVYTRHTSDLIVAAWGVYGSHRRRDAAVRKLVPGLKCFGVTKDGSPRHPLYLPKDAPLVDYRGAA